MISRPELSCDDVFERLTAPPALLASPLPSHDRPSHDRPRRHWPRSVGEIDAGEPLRFTDRSLDDHENHELAGQSLMRQIAEHLDRCPGCRQLAADLAPGLSLLHATAAGAPAPEAAWNTSPPDRAALDLAALDSEAREVFAPFEGLDAPPPSVAEAATPRAIETQAADSGRRPAAGASAPRRWFAAWPVWALAASLLAAALYLPTAPDDGRGGAFPGGGLSGVDGSAFGDPASFLNATGLVACRDFAEAQSALCCTRCHHSRAGGSSLAASSIAGPAPRVQPRVALAPSDRATQVSEGGAHYDAPRPEISLVGLSPLAMSQLALSCQACHTP